ncbi:MAG: hypothetical protein EBT07_05580 [Actinobacteria bacterium]|nr:hypothetical protein [Actinomycetota bacterium]
MASDLSGCVLVPLERLRALEALEASLPELLAKAKKDANKERFAVLHEKDKEYPEGAKERYKKHYEANKDAINARRREKRKEKNTILANTPANSQTAV